MVAEYLKDLTLGQLSCLADLPRHQSLRGWAQHHNLGIMAASRLVREVETKLGVPLLHRSNRGVAPTSDGEALAQLADRMLQLLAKNDLNLGSGILKPYERILNFGSRGFLNAALAGFIARVIEGQPGLQGVRFLDLSPEATSDAAKAASLDLCLVPDELELGKSWHRTVAGSLTWKIYGRPDHPLAAGSDLAGLRAFRVAHLAYWNGRQLVTSDSILRDLVPGHTNGHGAQTAASALAIAAETNVLACVPDLVAKAFLREGLVREIEVSDFDPVSVKLYLYVQQDRVPNRLLTILPLEISRHVSPG